jgi:hypothetical protein
VATWVSFILILGRLNKIAGTKVDRQSPPRLLLRVLSSIRRSRTDLAGAGTIKVGRMIGGMHGQHDNGMKLEGGQRSFKFWPSLARWRDCRADGESAREARGRILDLGT